jgi:hypothetical protein
MSTDDELAMYPIRDVIGGWFFKIEEISNGYYHVIGVDRRGRSVARDGINPDELLNLCKKDVEEMFLGRADLTEQ